jgi:hypothetical protein
MTDPMHDPALNTIRRYVLVTPDPETPRYLDLLHGNFTRLPAQERTRFLQALGHDARHISDTELEAMLSPGELAGWRERLTAAWLVGLDRRSQFRDVLGELLLESELTYAGQGYSFALTRLGQPEDADIFTAYLDRYLPRRECYYDQDWVLGGLLYLDDALGAHRAARFLTPGGLWRRSAFSSTEPTACHRQIATLNDFADQAMASAR